MRLIDSLMSIVNRTSPTQTGTKSEAYDELVLVLKRAMYDDTPSIATLRQMAVDATRKMLDADVNDCAKKRLP